MAYVTGTRATSPTLADRISSITKAVSSAIARRRVYARTLRELNALSTRELNDLGISASMIREVAREAAYGK